MTAPIYATLPDLRARLDRTDTSRDDELTARLVTASRQVEIDTGRTHGYNLDDTATAKVFNPRHRVVRDRDGERLLIPDIGDLTGLVVELGRDTSWTAITEYETGPDNAFDDGWAIEWLFRPLRAWQEWATQRVRVTARWGWPAVPAAITEATLLYAHRLYRRKSSPEGVAGFSDQGAVRVGRYDADYERLLSPYKRGAFG